MDDSVDTRLTQGNHPNSHIGICISLKLGLTTPPAGRPAFHSRNHVTLRPSMTMLEMSDYVPNTGVSCPVFDRF